MTRSRENVSLTKASGVENPLVEDDDTGTEGNPGPREALMDRTVSLHGRPSVRDVESRVEGRLGRFGRHGDVDGRQLRFGSHDEVAHRNLRGDR